MFGGNLRLPFRDQKQKAASDGSQATLLDVLHELCGNLSIFALDDSRVRNKGSCKVRRCQEQRKSLGKGFYMEENAVLVSQAEQRRSPQ